MPVMSGPMPSPSTLWQAAQVWNSCSPRARSAVIAAVGAATSMATSIALATTTRPRAAAMGAVMPLAQERNEASARVVLRAQLFEARGRFLGEVRAVVGRRVLIVYLRADADGPYALDDAPYPRGAAHVIGRIVGHRGRRYVGRAGHRIGHVPEQLFFRPPAAHLDARLGRG